MAESQAILAVPQVWVRLLLGVLLIAVGAGFFVNPLLLGIRHAGCYAGIAACTLGAVFFLLNGRISHWLGQVWANQHGRVFLCMVAGFLAICVIFPIAFSAGMVKAMQTAPQDEHTVVILGCKVRGTVPSLMLRRRLDAAAAYLGKHPELPVIVCGGQGADEEISEAQCMAEYLEEKGISPTRIYREDSSVNTRENLENAKSIMEQKALGYEVTIVTDGFHELRAALIAKDCGLTADAVPAKTSWYLAPSYWVREWMALAGFFIFG